MFKHIPMYFYFYKFIIIIAPSAVIIPTMHLGVIFSLKKIAAINADNTIDTPEVSGYRTAAGTNFAAIVLKYEYAKRHIAITHITRNPDDADFPSSEDEVDVER